jgi:acetyl-CoA carboxylase biotin carboxyl carrier protein
MLTFEELCQLIKVVADNRVGGVEIERDGVKVRIDGVQAAPPSQLLGGAPFLVAPHTPVGRAEHSTPQGPEPTAALPEAGDGDYLVTSPIVGTFYRAPSPETDAYVKVGDWVEKGQVLCIVEAMKLMNEIEADVAGTVTACLVEDGHSVEYGQPLFKIA